MENQIIKIKKVFIFNGFTFKIVIRNEYYSNSKDPLEMLRVVADNGKLLPINIVHKETLKSIQSKSIDMLETVLKSKGIDYLKKELS